MKPEARLFDRNGDDSGATGENDRAALGELSPGCARGIEAPERQQVAVGDVTVLRKEILGDRGAERQAEHVHGPTLLGEAGDHRGEHVGALGGGGLGERQAEDVLRRHVAQQ